MKIRAAVLEEFGKPLDVTGARPRRPEGGRGAGAADGLRGLPHGHVHGLRRRPVRLRARACSATRARASSRRSARASPRSRPATTSSRCSRPSAASACTASTPRTNLCLAIRERAEPGPPARRDDAPVARRRADPPLHGHLDLRRGDGHAGDRAGQGRPRGAACEPRRLFACGLSTGLGAAMYTAKVTRAPPAWCSGRAWSASAPSPAAACRAPSGSSASTSPRSGSSSPRGQGATDTWTGGEDTVARVLEETGGYGADFTFEATGLVRVMAPGRRGGAHGAGGCARSRAWPARGRRST